MEFLSLVFGAIKEIDAPTVVLFVMLLLALRAAEKAQGSEKFDWAEAFKDNGVLSISKVAVLVALGISSWIMVYAFMNGMRDHDDAAGLVSVLHELFWFFAAYMAIWGMGPKFVEKIGDAVLAKWSPTTIRTIDSAGGMSAISAGSGANVAVDSSAASVNAKP